jgi:hypothetical protein
VRIMEILKVLSISVASGLALAASAALALHWLLGPLEHWRQERLAQARILNAGPTRMAH